MLGAVLAGWATFAPGSGSAQAPEPARDTVRFPDPKTHVAQVEASIPAAGRDPVELMMAVWSSGYDRVEDHAGKAGAWTLEELPDATPEQAGHLRAPFAPSGAG